METLRQFYSDTYPRQTQVTSQYPLINTSRGEPLNNYTPKTRFRRIMYSLNAWARVNEEDLELTKDCKTPQEVIKKLKQNHLKTASIWKNRGQEPLHVCLDPFEMDRCFMLFNQLRRKKTYALTIKNILAYIGREDLCVFLK